MMVAELTIGMGPFQISTVSLYHWWKNGFSKGRSRETWGVEGQGIQW